MFNRKLNKKIEELNKAIEISNLREIVYILGDKKKMLFTNIIAGIGRGIGIGIGVTLITALIIYFLNKIVTLNIPLIGNFVTDIVDIVEKNSKY